RAPDLELLDHTGSLRKLSSFWSDGPALIMFWRHFGCGCGLDRASRLSEEYDAYLDAGITPVIIGQGEPERAAEYREKYEIDCPIL
ncbi:MAG: redoxin domain-containing protein, partial [Candidatus Thalassarchaeaceae archaeon]